MKADRDYRHTVIDRARRDMRFRKGLLRNAVEALQENELQTSKDMLRNYIEATEGLNFVAAKCGHSKRSLSWMLGPHSNPRARNYFAVLAVLLKDANASLTLVRTRHSQGALRRV